MEPPESSAIFTVLLTEVSPPKDSKIPKYVLVSTHTQLFQERVQLIEGELSNWAFASVAAGFQYFSHERSARVTKLLIEKYHFNPRFSALLQSAILTEYRCAQEQTRMFGLPGSPRGFDRLMIEHGSPERVKELISQMPESILPIPTISASPSTPEALSI